MECWDFLSETGDIFTDIVNYRIWKIPVVHADPLHPVSHPTEWHTPVDLLHCFLSAQ